MTSKLQVTIPKAVAEQFGIRPGDKIDWVPDEAYVRRQGGRGHVRKADIRRYFPSVDHL